MQKNKMLNGRTNINFFFRAAQLLSSKKEVEEKRKGKGEKSWTLFDFIASEKWEGRLIDNRGTTLKD